MLGHHLGITVKGVFDTMLASQLIMGSQRFENYSLANILQHFLEITIDKTEQVSDWSIGQLTQSQLEYAVRDVTYLIPLYEAQRAKLKELNLILDFGQKLI